MTVHRSTRSGWLAGLFAGLMTALASFVICATWLLHWEVQGLEQRNTRLSQNVQHATLDINQILVELTRSGPVSCTEVDVATLRRVLAKYRVIQGIGVIDAKGQVSCTTELTAPKAANNESRTDQAQIDAQLGRPVLRTISIIRRPFGITLDPTVTHMLSDQVDAAWYGRGKAPTLLNIRTERTVEQKAALERALDSGKIGQLDWTVRSYIHTIRVPDTAFIVQSVIQLGPWAWPRLLPVMLLCFALAVVVGSAAMRIFGVRPRASS